MRYFDNTRIEAFRKCERSFYFRHVRHWAPDTTKAALAFGGAWHAALDVIWETYCGAGSAERASTAAVVGAAMFAFEEKWTEEGFPGLNDFLALSYEEQQKIGMRNPMTAAEMLYGYIEAREDMMRHRFRPADEAWIEQPFAVPLSLSDPNLWYVGRWDKRVVRVSDGAIFGIEHKTTSEYRKEGGFKADYLESYNPNSQVMGYLYAGKVQYGHAFKGILIDHALVHKTVHDAFALTPIELHLEQLEAWLWETRARIEDISRDTTRLDRERAEGMSSFLPAFPRKTEQCIGKYGRCPFLDLCRSDANPERWDDPPAGWKVEKWEPFDELRLDAIGLERPVEDNNG